MNNESLEKWKEIMKVWDSESTRFLSRNNFFLVFNGALLILISSYTHGYFYKFVVSVFGVFFILIWLYMNKRGRYYQDRWKKVLNCLEQDNNIKPFEILEKEEDEDKAPKKTFLSFIKSFRKITRLIDLVLIILLLIWVMFGIHFGLKL